MDFFRAQDAARKNTGRLIVFFSLAVLSLIMMTNLLVMVVFGVLDARQTAAPDFLGQVDWGLIGTVSLGVMAVIGLGSLYKTMALAGGGARVAEMLGGRLLVRGDSNPDHQKVLNVVEEMAIASGLPVPPVYLLDERAINAFAAGYSPGDAVIGVTRGTIEKLSRDELQGVIAHEFSHIVNGDMRLNIRLIGILHGIMVLGLIGYYILRSSSHSRSSRKEGGGIMFLGLGLMIIGYSGTFFGNLIKAAVSRQREFLADASAVQFTRNPAGIGGALQRIGADASGSVLENPNTAEISHALFSQGFTSFFGGLFATHPPLTARIKKILPAWDGRFAPAVAARKPAPGAGGARPVTAAAGQRRRSAALSGVAAALQSGRGFEDVGRPTMAHLDHARQVLDDLPPSLSNATREPYAARALIYFLVLDHTPAVRARQLEHLKAAADTGVYDETLRLAGRVEELRAEYRLTLIDMALPTLRQLSRPQYERFRENLRVLIEADGRISLFEWSLQRIVLHHLDALFARGHRRAGGAWWYTQATLAQAGEACAVLLSTLIQADRQNGLSNEDVLALAVKRLDGLAIPLLGKKRLGLSALNRALDELALLQPLEKEKLLNACGACVTADGVVSPVEVELVRAIADSLDCPMPPFLV